MPAPRRAGPLRPAQGADRQAQRCDQGDRDGHRQQDHPPRGRPRPSAERSVDLQPGTHQGDDDPEFGQVFRGRRVLTGIDRGEPQPDRPDHPPPPRTRMIGSERGRRARYGGTQAAIEGGDAHQAEGQLVVVHIHRHLRRGPGFPQGGIPLPCSFHRRVGASGGGHDRLMHRGYDVLGSALRLWTF